MRYPVQAMNMKINNLRVSAFGDIASPSEVLRQAKITDRAAETVVKAREDIQNILDGKDHRKIIIVGPCSIHDSEAALEYAEKLNALRKKVEGKFVIVMRTYFEKPRTTIGWKGFIYDPYLDDSYSLKEGVVLARKMLIEINDMGLPTGTEVLGPIVIQYYSDLICWSAIGARTAESQTHRELASGLSMPVGFKNGTEGNVDVAVNAILSAESPHNFLGMDDEGKVSVVSTTGNPYGHIILRGGNGTNYSSKDVALATNFCKKAGVKPRIIIDCSHANSEKDHRNQVKVWDDVMGQIKNGSENIMGLMLESNLFEGSQKISSNLDEMKYGISVTDSCISWDETKKIISDAYKNL